MHSKQLEQVLALTESNIEGLNPQQVILNRDKFGTNSLASEEKISIPKIFISQFLDLVVIILIIASVISALSSHIESAMVIVIVITLNAMLGTYQTVKSYHAVKSIKKMSSLKSKVIRDGQKMEINSSELVVGDLIFFESGDIIGADAYLIEANNLKVTESSLTGESVAIDKKVTVCEETRILAERENILYSSDQVVSGSGKAIIFAVGKNSEIGKISQILEGVESTKTVLQEKIEDFSKKLAFYILGICVLVFVLVYLKSHALMPSLLFAIALAVAAIPEALVPIITIILSLGSQKLAKENAIVKDLHSVETLGSVDIICTDKTGTLTVNKMKVVAFYQDFQEYSVSDHASQTLLASMVECNDAHLEGEIGDPTEVSLLEFAKNQNYINYNQRIDILPFDSDRKLMSILNNQNILYTKGAFDNLIELSDKILVNGEIKDLTETDKEKLKEINNNYASNGLRVLAYGFKQFSGNLTFAAENHLCFIGLTAMIDPPREEVIEAVKKCTQAGIKPIMITGDHKLTAKAIASKLGIFREDDLILEGKEIDAMDDGELSQIIEKVSVYARVSPENKIRIVKLLQKLNHLVAMSGDGVNDAPAIKQANIGIAMGITGSEVSKEAANMILVDDNYATIVQAVINGRNIFRNIKNSINYLLSGNLAAIIIVLAFSLFTSDLPFTTIHLLFMNLVTDSLPAIALGMEEKDDSLLVENPKNLKNILDHKNLKSVIFAGIMIAIVTIAAYLITKSYYGSFAASTVAFLVLTLSRLLHGFSCRNHLPIYKYSFLGNKASNVAFILGILAITVILFVPYLSYLFEIAPLNLMIISIAIISSIFGFFLVQLGKILGF